MNLARAKSEAVDDIFLKQNKKKNRIVLRGEGSKNGLLFIQNISPILIGLKHTLNSP